MEPLGVLLIIALVAGMYLFRKGTRAASRAVTRTIRKGAHAEGTQLVSQVLDFTTPAPPPATLEAIAKSVNAYPSAPAVVPGLHQRAIDANTLAFVYGSKVHEVFTGVLTCGPCEGGARGRYQIARWSEGDGIVARRDEMTQVRDRITSAVHQLGGQIQGAQ